ncbi:MAG TPA: hypothetical protein VGM21_01975 [Actinomycetota bacterium]
MGDEALRRRRQPVRVRGGQVRWPGAAAALALVLALAACSGPGGDRNDRAGTTTGRPVAGAGGPTRPGAVWSSGPRSGPRRGDGGAVLAEIRAARQPGYDRLVFEFEGGLPGYRARFVDRAALGEGPDLEGAAFLLLSLDGASVGDAAVRDLHPRLGSLKEVRLLDQVGGRLRFAVGVDAVAGYLAHDLPDPDRVIVDVAA